MNTSLKTCFKCNIEKPLTEFYRHKAMGDGHLNKCKSCAKSDVEKHRIKNIEKIRRYDRERGKNPSRIAKAKLVIKRWKEDHPKRRQAQVALGNAVRSGKIIPWTACFIPDCNAKPEAHHADYDRPLDVVWLCRAHHAQAHALTKKLIENEPLHNIPN